MQKIIISNIRVPEEDWLSFKATAASRGMSINQYMIYLGRQDSIKSITGTSSPISRKIGYEAMDEFIKLARKNRGRGMGASEDDKIIYDI